MKVLGIDSSGLVASVAIVEEDRLLAEYTVNYKKTHSQTLLPMLDEIVRMTEQELGTVDVIAVAAGPGSFTGLRIGSATAKGLGLALKKPVAAVPTLEGLAYQCWGTDGVICPMMDARRNQIYTGLYEFRGEELQVLENQTALSVEEMIEKINALGRRTLLLGDGAFVYREQLEQGLKVSHFFAPAHKNMQSAAAVAALGLRYARAGKLQSAAEHQPDYLKLSQAEREREKKKKQEQESHGKTAAE